MGRRYKYKIARNNKLTLDELAKEVDIMFEEDKWMWDILKHYKDVPTERGELNALLQEPISLKDNTVDKIC